MGRDMFIAFEARSDTGLPWLISTELADGFCMAFASCFGQHTAEL